MVLATAVLFGVGVALPANGDAATGIFRQSHGEPLNDLRVTPGATFKVTIATICRPGYATSVRDVPESEKDAVYAEYGITHHVTDQYEIDHLIPLELGGSNAEANLWPELNDHPRGYLNSKDILENRLHDLVCSGRVRLASAQRLIAVNWVAAYHEFLGSWPTRGPASSATTTQAPGSSATTTTTGSVRITSVVASIAPGGEESLTVHSPLPDDACTLAVILPSGRQSTADGLGASTTDAGGDVTWTWEIGPTTDPGTAHVDVRCSAGVAAGSFTIT